MAEVLITLAIIGVIAAMTITTLVQNYQKHLFATRLKQTYAIYSQAYLRSQADNGDTKTWGKTLTKDNESITDVELKEYTYDFTKTYLTPYIKGDLIIDDSQTWQSLGYPNGVHELSDPTKNAWCMQSKPRCVFELANGSIVVLMLDNASGIYFRNLLMYVDTNGKQGPNIMGKDWFLMYFEFSTGKLRMWGDQYSRADLLTACKSNNAQPCGALIQRDNWAFADDYPW